MTDRADLLATVPLLADVDRKRLERLANDFSERQIPAGGVIVHEGDERGMGFFVIAEGEAVVTIGDREVRRLGKGDYFGEIALISDRVRTSTVTASTDVRCLVMTLWDFRAFVRSDAEVAWKLLEHVGAMLHTDPATN